MMSSCNVAVELELLIVENVFGRIFWMSTISPISFHDSNFKFIVFNQNRSVAAKIDVKNVRLLRNSVWLNISRFVLRGVENFAIMWQGVKQKLHERKIG